MYPGQGIGADSLATAAAVPLMFLIFALFMLVAALTLVHLLRGVATVNQLKEQIAQQYQEHAPAIERRPPVQATVPDFGSDEDLEAAVRASSRYVARNGDGKVITQLENANVRDEQEPIPGGGYYARQSDTPQ